MTTQTELLREAAERVLTNWDHGYSAGVFGRISEGSDTHQAYEDLRAALSQPEQAEAAKPETERGKLLARGWAQFECPVCGSDGAWFEGPNATDSKDAGRLDWLHQKLFVSKWNGVIDSGSSTSWHIAGDYRHTTVKMNGATFREAIDAAMQTKEAS